MPEWGLGYLNNRHRIFLGRWAFVDELFELAYITCTELANWSFLYLVCALATNENYCKKLEKYNADPFQNDA